MKKERTEVYKLFCLLLFFTTVSIVQCRGQDIYYTYKGRVLDSISKKPLEYVNIVINNSNQGVSTNLKGEFIIHSKQRIFALTFSRIAYKNKKVTIKENIQANEFYLNPKSYILDEVKVYPGKNPALRIIENVIEHKKQNNFREYPRWKYSVYEKISGDILKDPRNLSAEELNDSLSIYSKQKKKRKNYIPLPLTEKTIDVNWYSKNNIKEKITAINVSGFKNPFWQAFHGGVKMYNFYENFIKLNDIGIGKEIYPGLFTKKGIKNYAFILKDSTCLNNKDTIFQIDFFGRKKTRFKGVAGTFKIHSKNWALIDIELHLPFKLEIESQNIIDSAEIIYSQKYQCYADSIYFPKKISFLSIFKYQNGFFLKYDSKIDKLILKEESAKDRSIISLSTDKSAMDKPKEYWKNLRGDSLFLYERDASLFWDSLGQKKNLDRYTELAFEVVTGEKAPIISKKPDTNSYFRLGRYFLDHFDYKYLFGYNNFEGLRLGLGLKWTKKILFARNVKFGGYAAYGFKDYHLKYGANVFVPLSIEKGIGIHVNAASEAERYGSLDFFPAVSSFNFLKKDFTIFYINEMNYTHRANAYFESRLFRHFKIKTGVYVKDKDYLNFEKIPLPEKNIYSSYRLAGYHIGLHITPFEKVVSIADHLFSMGTKYPELHINYIAGLNDLLDGEYQFNRIDLNINYLLDLKLLGKTYITANAGYMEGLVPESSLYNLESSYGKCGVYAYPSFNTMRWNEFTSNKYAGIFITHVIGHKIFRNPDLLINPQLVIYHNMGIGDLDSSYKKVYTDKKTMNLGYYESGIGIDKVYGALGMSFFYRYGPYSYESFKENYAIKFHLKFSWPMRY
ncbi:MAG: DUF5686 family protein [Bacteroidales bacterium]